MKKIFNIFLKLSKFRYLLDIYTKVAYNFNDIF